MATHRLKVFLTSESIEKVEKSTKRELSFSEKLELLINKPAAKAKKK